MEPDVTSLGETVQKLRKDKNLTQRQLAKLLDFSQPTVSKIETGRQRPNLVFATRFRQAYGLDLMELMS